MGEILMFRELVLRSHQRIAWLSLYRHSVYNQLTPWRYLSLTGSRIFGHISPQRLQITQAFAWFWDKTTFTLRVGVGHLNKFVAFMSSPTLNLKNFEKV